MINAGEARARAAEDALNTVLSAYLDRSIGVITARMRGPKGRKHTRWWTETKSGAVAVLEREFKAVDPDYVVPDKLTAELRDEVTPVALRIASSAATETADRLGDNTDLSEFDAEEIEQAVADAVARILGVAERHAREVRAAVLDADEDADSIDEVLERIEAAHQRGGNWLLMAGRTLGNALANEAALQSAMRLGVTHTQWLSRRDDRVRHTHVAADGQVRHVGDRFKVGRFELIHPGDPRDLPDSWEEIANCRCSLAFRRLDDAAKKMNAMAEKSKADAGMPAETLAALEKLVAASVASNTGEVITPTPEGYGLPPVASLVKTKQPIIAYRALSAPLAAVPGQTITLPGRPVLGLSAPAAGALVLTVMIPAEVEVGVAGGAVVLAEGTTFELLGVSAGGATAQVVA